MLKDQNGLPYKLDGKFRIYDPRSPKNKLFSKWDAEAIKIGGSPIFYYECLIQFSSLDTLFHEDRGKLFSPCAIQLYATYEPPDQVANSTIFGVDTPDMEAIFELNSDATIEAVGHPPKVGSRIYTPHLCEDWIIIDRRQGEFKAWGALHYILHCKKFPYNKTDHSDNFIKPNVIIK